MSKVKLPMGKLKYLFQVEHQDIVTLGQMEQVMIIFLLLFPGTYTVDITDANGCMITDTAVINPGTNPSADITVQDVSCFGANDGLMITSAWFQEHLLIYFHLMEVIHLCFRNSIWSNWRGVVFYYCSRC